ADLSARPPAADRQPRPGRPAEARRPAGRRALPRRLERGRRLRDRRGLAERALGGPLGRPGAAEAQARRRRPLAAPAFLDVPRSEWHLLDPGIWSRSMRAARIVLIGRPVSVGG